MGLDELVERSWAEASAGRWLDAYLLAAGAWQVCEDRHVGTGHAQLSVLRHAVADRSDRALRVVESLWGLREATAALGARWGRGRRLGRAESVLAGVLVELAHRVLGSASPSPGDGIVARLAEVRGLVGRLPPRDRTSVGTVPSSFRSFDQRPADVAALVARLTALRTPLEAPVVVGVRTSGAYLAPLALAALEDRGVSGATMLSMRPGAHLNPYARARARHRGAASEFIVVDDPPTSGAALAAVARGLGRFTAGPEGVTLLVATVGDDGALPAALDPYPRVTLPFREWAVHRELAPEGLAPLIAPLLAPGERLGGLEVAGLDPPSPRGHQRVVARARVVSTGALEVERLFAVRGVGLGYLGRDALEVGRAMSSAVARPLALAGAVLVEEPLEDVGRWPPPPVVVVEYLARRAAALSAPRDASADRGLARSVSEVAASLVARSLGPRASGVAAVALGPVVRRALRVERPVVIDGAIGRQHWGQREGLFVKRDYADGAFSNRDLACYDLAYDLASSALDGDGDRASALRELYATSLGAEVDDARWMLYTLVALWERRRAGEIDRFEYARRRSSVTIDFLSRLYLGDLTPTRDGPIAVLDLDGVLETFGGGYSAPGRLGMMSVRALGAHGYRVVVATGRSASEVAHRVRSLRLAGGVAEYGSVVVTADGTVRTTLAPEDLATLEAVRARLTRLEGFEVDPGFAHSVRIAHRHHGGRLPQEEWDRLSGVLERGETLPLTAYPGVHQVDLVREGVTKATGLAALVGRADADGPLVRLAVGDTVADRPLLERAEVAVVPRNAAGDLRRGGFVVTAGRFQAGVAEAVAREIGHRPGRCPTCRAPERDAGLETLARALSLDEAGRVPALLRTASLLAEGWLRR